MKTRKIILLAADVLLLVVLILQLSLKAGDRTKVFAVSEDPDEVVITTTSENYTLVKENDEWFLGEKKYPANDNYINTMVTAAKSVKVLDKVASGTNETVLDRYELSENQMVSIVLKKDGKVLRTIKTGKNATAGSQTYVMIDDSKDIYLATGNLRSEFEKPFSYFRSRVVFDLDQYLITSVSITDEKGESWSVSKMGSGTDVAWNCTGAIVDIDGAKASEWFGNLAMLTTPTWYDENEALGGKKIISSKIECNFKTITLDIYEVAGDGDEEKTTYWGKSSVSPYPFVMAGYSVQRFQKKVEELAK